MGGEVRDRGKVRTYIAPSVLCFDQRSPPRTILIVSPVFPCTSSHTRSPNFRHINELLILLREEKSNHSLPSTKQSAGITNQQLDQELFSCSFFLSVQSYRLGKKE